MKRTILSTLAVALAVFTTARAADAPQTINYQGKLLNSSSSNVSDGTYTIQFKIYGASTGSTLLWGASSSVVVSSGSFNVLLGQQTGSPIAGATYTAIGDALAATTTPYLGLTVTVDSSGPVSNPQEISPRLQFLSSPYALVAHTANTATTAATATNALQLGGQSASAYLIPASTAATTLQGAIVMQNTTTINNTIGINGTAWLEGVIHLDGPVSIGAGGTSGGGFVPIGGIIMWSGSITAVPAGWAICDGTQGTPDLRNRFIIGSGSGGSYAVGQTGGATATTLTASMIPDHKHQYKDTVFAENNINYYGTGPEGLGAGVDGSNSNAGSHNGYDSDNMLSWVYRTTLYTRSGTTSPNTSNDSVPTMPPYYGLAYIKRIQ